MNGNHLLIDTNILIYSETNDEKEKHDMVILALERIKTQGDILTISIQNINEFSNNMIKKSKLSDSSINEIITSYQSTFSLIFFNLETIREANRISRATGIHFYDALLTATMHENGIDTIITENEKDFQKIPWLKVINPFKNEIK
ncbi:PIN domain-containing protein [Candidatus Micrarchaeota archaeon]|nr:PIN domain-containing protein [Candidatus Micrarchaeota archaeon]